jgi:hypothetical protein
MQSIAPQCVIKGADQSVASSTTLQNDNALFLPLVANATYLFDVVLDYEGGTGGSSDLKWTWVLPTGATLRYVFTESSSAGVAAVNMSAGSAVNTAGTNGAAFLKGVLMKGSVIVGSTAGTAQLQWAQGTANATPTIVHAQSYLALWRIT